MAVERRKYRNRKTGSVEITNVRVEREKEGEQEHRKMQCQRDAAGKKKSTQRMVSLSCIESHLLFIRE